MKVYLGGFNGPIRVRWVDRYVRGKYPETWYNHKPETLTERFIDLLENIAQVMLDWSINPLLLRLPERFEYVHIDSSDTWNLDTTFARIIHPALVMFKDNLHSYPSRDSLKEDAERICELSKTAFGYSPVIIPETSTEVMDYEYWKIILDEMIWAFKHAMDGEWKWAEPYYNEHSFDTDAIDRMQRRINNGIDLFSRYYFDLWD